MARDHFGIKPFFYTFKNNNFIFGSEIKALLEHPEISANVDADGICELFGIGPAHTPGLTPFKNIFEYDIIFISVCSIERGIYEKFNRKI